MASKKEKSKAKQGLLDPDLIFDIDKNLLDDEWMNQPKLYFRWAEQLEDARDALEKAKAAFDVVKSEIELAIREKPSDFGLDVSSRTGSVTEKAVTAAIPLQKEYKEAQQEMFEAKHRVGILQGVVVALEHRKKGLEKLVDLHGQKYFATPRASEHSREMVDEIEKRSVRQKTKARNRR